MEGFKRKNIVKELKKQLWLAAPIFLVNLLQYGLQMISIMFVGHLGKLALSSSSIASSFISVLGFNLLNGMASALNTLCGQSFGANQLHMLGIHTQRAMLLLSIASLFLSIICANIKPILILMHQDATISEEAGHFAYFMIPSIFAYGLLQWLVSFLQTQNNVFPMVLISALVFLLHVSICWVLVFKSRLGSKGAALANSISYWVNLIILTLYVHISSSCANTWIGLSKEAMCNIYNFLKVSIPSLIMSSLKAWTFELMVIIAGFLPNPILETSVLSICLNTSTMVWLIPRTLSSAVSVRVSNELGAKHPQATKLAVGVVIFVAVIEGVMVAAAMVGLRSVWGQAFSNEKQVVKSIADFVPIIAITNFLAAIQTVLSGVARGCGWQKIGAFITVGTFYLVGVPVSILLAFRLDLKAKGLWLGILTSLLLQVILYLLITASTELEIEAIKVARRMDTMTHQDETTIPCS